MKKIVKCVALLSAAAICVSVAAGCSGGKSDMKTATIWMNVGHSKQYWTEKVQNFNNEKSKELGVELVLDSKTDDSYSQQLEIALKSDQLPEFFFDGGCGKEDELGLSYPISDLPGMEDMIAEYENLMVENIHKVGDKVYCLPEGMTTRGLIYNKDMFVAAGLVDENGEAKPPKTFDEVREYAKKLTNTSKNQYGIALPVKWAAWTESDITTIGISNSGYDYYKPATGEYDYTALEPIINMIMGIKEDGSCYPGAEGLDNDPARAKFAEGNIGMKISYSFDVGVFNIQFPAKCDWGVAPLPVEDPEHCYKQMARVGSSLQVSKKAVDELGTETVAEIYKYLYNDDTWRDLYIKGLEIPINWDVVSDVKLGDDAPKGWKEFSQMASISIPDARRMPTDLKDSRSFSDIMLNDIWTGKTTDIKGTLEAVTKAANDGIAVYKESHKDNDIDYDSYIISNWDEMVRRDSYWVE